MRQLDYEGEIAAIIGKKIKSADEKTAEESICALAVVNDVSARDYQEQISPPFGKNWVMGKAADSFLPISSWVKLYEGDPVEFTTEVNGWTENFSRIYWNCSRFNINRFQFFIQLRVMINICIKIV